MKTILILIMTTAVSLISASAHADYNDGATIKCAGRVVEDGVEFPVNSSRVYSYAQLELGPAQVFFNSAEDTDWGADFSFFVSGFIMQTGPGYSFRGEGVAMNLDLIMENVVGTQIKPTFRIDQKFSESPATTFSWKGTWSSEDHKDSLELSGKPVKFDYDVSCTVLTN